MTAVKFTRSCLIGMMLVIGVSGCVYDPYYSGPPPAHRYYPYYYPYYYDYYFYPSVRVYFQYSTGYYFYYSRDRWIRTKVLPPYIHLSPWERVKIRVDSNRPYLKYKEHVKKYPPKARPPEYRQRPPVAKPAPGTVWDRAKQPQTRQPEYRDRPPTSKPAPGSVWDRNKAPPASRSVPPSGKKPGTAPYEKREPPQTRQEREHNKRIFQEHQKKQKQYEKEWEKSNKVYRR